MPIRKLASSLVAVAVAVTLGGPSLAWGQAGWYAVPRLSLAEQFDDNVFSQISNRKSDFVTLIAPGLTAGYQSTPLTLLGSYSFGAELYADNSELNGINNQAATLDFRYLPTQALTLSLTAGYFRSKSTSPLVQPASPEPRPPATVTPATGAAAAGPSVPPIVGVNVGRQTTTQVVVSPSLSYALTPRTGAEAGYGYSTTHVEGGSEDTEHQFSLGVSHQATPLDRLGAHYRLRYFDSNQEGSLTSHAVTGSYVRQVTPQLTASLEAGPSITGGTVGAEIAASLVYRFRLATASLSYTRTQGIVAGRAGAQTTDTGAAAVSFELTQALRLDVSGSVLRTESVKESSNVDTIYAAGLGLGYRLTEWLTARAAYRFSLEDQRAGEIRHHIVSVGLDFAYPIRLY